MRRRGTAWAAIATLGASLAGCGGPGVDQLAAGPKAIVTEIRSGDAVVLKTGQVVRLAGVEAPKGSDPFAREAREALSKLVLGREVQLMYGGARQDAYGRALAHLKLAKGGAWVEKVLLEDGDARVHTWPDNRALARPMLDAEARARVARRGLWGLPAYQVRLPDEAAARPFGFQVVEGRVTSAAERDGAVRLDIERWVEAEVPREAEGAFASSGLALVDLPGKLVRIRGLMRPGSGEGLMKLDHPEQIEVLKEAK
ncbi:MAG TPA: thermonuclease family protein [Caulobacteraceae bacterium]|jgi:endonuclease YncB( thermonuclease family)